MGVFKYESMENGKISLSIALGATGTIRSDTIELADQDGDDSSSGHPDGTGKDGESHIIGEDEENYINTVLKIPAISTFFYLTNGF